MKLVRLIALLLFITPYSYGQESSDSIKVVEITQDFYSWYGTSIRESKHEDYLPQFVKSDSGKTTLDFKRYFENLRSHSFSADLITRERESYQTCMDNYI